MILNGTYVNLDGMSTVDVARLLQSAPIRALELTANEAEIFRGVASNSDSIARTFATALQNAESSIGA